MDKKKSEIKRKSDFALEKSNRYWVLDFCIMLRRGKADAATSWCLVHLDLGRVLRVQIDNTPVSELVRLLVQAGGGWFGNFNIPLP